MADAHRLDRRRRCRARRPPTTAPGWPARPAPSASAVNSWTSTTLAASVGVSIRAATNVDEIHTAYIAIERTARWHAGDEHRPVAHPRRPGAGGVRPEDGDEPRRRAGLDDHRAPRRTGDAEVQPVDGDDLQHEVDDVGDDDDDQRLAQIVEAAHHPVTDERDEHERQADGADPQVQHGVVQHVAATAEHPAQRSGGERRRRRRRARRASPPARARPSPSAAACVASPDAVGERDVGRDPVLQERRQRDEGQQDGRRRSPARRARRC